MHRNKIAALASTALCLSFALTGNAGAADIITKAPKVAAAPVPAANPWAGFYIGVNAGYSWGKVNTRTSIAPFDSGPVTFPGGSSTADLKPNGGVAGGQIGYLLSFAPNWYAGIEADFQWTGQKDSGRGRFSGTVVGTCTTFFVCDYTNSTDITAKFSWFGTVRGLVGTDFSGLFVYGTFGLAYGKVKITGENKFNSTDVLDDPSLIRTTSFSGSSTETGYAAGLGIAGFLMRDVIWRLEYLHIDLGTVGTQKFNDPPLQLTVKTAKFTDDIVRVSLIWKLTQ